MCHSRWYREERIDERFEKEVRDLMDRERRRAEPATPVVEHDTREGPVAEPEREPVPTARD